MDNISKLLIHKTSRSREIETLSQDITWLVRQIDVPALRFAAFNCLSDGVGEFILSSSSTDRHIIHFDTDNKIEIVQKILSDIIPIIQAEQQKYWESK